MPSITRFEILPVNLPFRQAFKHSAAERSCSNSLFLRCTLDSSAVGYGECLPREYVSGESQDGTLALLGDHILPRLIGQNFHSMEEVEDFLCDCDGKTPGWVDGSKPQTAAWSAVDLALLDAFGHHFGRTVLKNQQREPAQDLRYSGVLSSETGIQLIRSCLKMRLFGLRSIKMKVDQSTPDRALKTATLILGEGVLRVDANMAWTRNQAARAMKRMARQGVRLFEQPLPADDLEGMAHLVAETGLEVMADESLTDEESLRRLIEHKACTAVNVRISKCGGLLASLNRCREAQACGLEVQIGCQVGESSLLSAAHLALVAALGKARYLEGCFGHYLLRNDPFRPVLQFGYGGRAPRRPPGPGLGVEVNRHLLRSLTRGQPTLIQSGR